MVVDTHRRDLDRLLTLDEGTRVRGVWRVPSNGKYHRLDRSMQHR